MRSVAIALAFCMTLTGSNSSFATPCQTMEPLEALASPSVGAVFLGAVHEVNRGSGEHGALVCQVMVLECWKGPYKPGQNVQITTGGLGICEYPFQPGGDYIIFTFGTGGGTNSLLPNTLDVEGVGSQLGPPVCTTAVEAVHWALVKRLFR